MDAQAPNPSTEATTSELLNYANATTEISQLLNEFDSFVEEPARKNRSARYIDIDVEAMRRSDVIAKSDTILPIRVIDTNIRREHPDFMEYLTGSHRVAVFLDKDDLNARFPTLEEYFSAGLRYEGWFLPFFKAYDGAATHGWDSVELVIDTDKPLHVAFEHVGHDNLIFPVKNTDNIQACKRIMRRYRVKLTTLEQMADDNKFDATQVKYVREKLDKTKDETTYIYKVFTKVDGIVYIGWWCKECQEWLRAPKKLVLGQFVQEETMSEQDVIDVNGLTDTVSAPEIKLTPAPVTKYPVFMQYYYATEQAGVMDNKGRAFLDKYIQEGVTTLYSNFLNGATKASQLFASVEREKDIEADLAQLDVAVEGDAIYNKPIKFHAPPYPDESLIRSAGALLTVNSEQAGQITYAANNRVDSRKTAREVSSAMQEESKLTSVSLLLLSGYFGGILNFAWQIIANRLQNNLIKAPDEIRELSMKRFQLLPAGDVDIIKRNAELQLRQAAWPLVAQTALAPVFLADTLALMFPRQAAQYRLVLEQAMQQQQAATAVVQELMAMSATPIPPETQQRILATVTGQQPQQAGDASNANQDTQ